MAEENYTRFKKSIVDLERWEGYHKSNLMEEKRGWKGLTEGEEGIKDKRPWAFSRVSSYKVEKLRQALHSRRSSSDIWPRTMFYISSLTLKFWQRLPEGDVWPVRWDCASDKLQLQGKTKRSHIQSEKLILHLHILKEIPLGLPSLPPFPSLTKTLTLRYLWPKSAFITKRKRNFNWAEELLPGANIAQFRFHQWLWTAANKYHTFEET